MDVAFNKMFPLGRTFQESGEGRDGALVTGGRQRGAHSHGTSSTKHSYKCLMSAVLLGPGDGTAVLPRALE